MRTSTSVPFAIVLGVAVALAGGPAWAECSAENWKECEGKPWVIGKAETPIGERWWPNKLWGDGDEAGATNWYTKAEVVQRALAEADKGKVYKLGRPYQSTMPMFGERKFEMTMPSVGSGGPAGGNAVVYKDELVTTQIGQVGTQFDGVGHIAVSINGVADASDVRYYNGFKESDVVASTGLKKLGVEKLHPIVARGVLLSAGRFSHEALEEAKREGIELTGEMDFTDDLSLFVSYSYNDSTYDDNVVNALGAIVQATAGATVVNTPSQLLKADLTFDNDTFFATLSASYTGERESTYTNVGGQIDGHTAIDLTGGYRFGGTLDGFELQLNVVNLLDEEYVSTIGSNGFSASDPGNTGQTLLVAPPRQVFVTLRKTF